VNSQPTITTLATVATPTPREGVGVAASTTRRVYSTHPPEHTLPLWDSQPPSRDTSPSRDTTLPLATGVATGENRGFLVYDKRFGIGRTIKMGDSWCTKAGDLCVGFFDLKATEHPPILPMLVPFASVRIIPAHVQVQLEDAGRADVRKDLTPVPLREPDPMLLAYLRKHQVSLVPDRRVYFDSPNHGFSEDHGRILCEDSRRLLPGLDKNGDPIQDSVEIKLRKDGPFKRVVDEREIEFAKRLAYNFPNDALNSDKNKPPAERPEDKGTDRYPTPPGYRVRLQKLAARGYSKDDLASGAIVLNGERRMLNGMFDYRTYNTPKRIRKPKPQQPERPIISWLPEASEYVKPSERELAAITQLWNEGYGPAQIAKKLRKSERTVRRRLEYLLANEPNPRNISGLGTELPETHV
jgi:hypothetical protein